MQIAGNIAQLGLTKDAAQAGKFATPKTSADGEDDSWVEAEGFEAEVDRKEHPWGISPSVLDAPCGNLLVSSCSKSEQSSDGQTNEPDSGEIPDQFNLREKQTLAAHTPINALASLRGSASISPHHSQQTESHLRSPSQPGIPTTVTTRLVTEELEGNDIVPSGGDAPNLIDAAASDLTEATNSRNEGPRQLGSPPEDDLTKRPQDRSFEGKLALSENLDLADERHANAPVKNHSGSTSQEVDPDPQSFVEQTGKAAQEIKSKQGSPEQQVDSSPTNAEAPPAKAQNDDADGPSDPPRNMPVTGEKAWRAQTTYKDDLQKDRSVEPAVRLPPGLASRANFAAEAQGALLNFEGAAPAEISPGTSTSDLAANKVTEAVAHPSNAKQKTEAKFDQTGTTQRMSVDKPDLVFSAPAKPNEVWSSFLQPMDMADDFGGLAIGHPPHSLSLASQATGLGPLPPTALRHNPLWVQVKEAIVGSVDGQKSSLTELTLSPEELGKVRLEVTTQDDKTTIRVFAERPETLELLRKSSESLTAELRQAGLSQGSLSFGSWTDSRRSSSGKQPENEHSVMGPAMPSPPSAVLRPQSAAPSGRLHIRL